MENLGIDDHTIHLGLVSDNFPFLQKPIIRGQNDSVLTLVLTQICTAALVASTLIGRHIYQSHNGNPVLPSKSY